LNRSEGWAVPDSNSTISSTCRKKLSIIIP
jgi:hypothetical protein